MVGTGDGHKMSHAIIGNTMTRKPYAHSLFKETEKIFTFKLK